MPTEPQFPAALDDDTDDVSWALETGRSMWQQGDHKEALRWLKRAADGAADEGKDERSLALAKTAADLRSFVETTPKKKSLPKRRAPKQAGSAALPTPARDQPRTPPPASAAPPATPPPPQSAAPPPARSAAAPPAPPPAPFPPAPSVPAARESAAVSEPSAPVREPRVAAAEASIEEISAVSVPEPAAEQADAAPTPSPEVPPSAGPALQDPPQQTAAEQQVTDLGDAPTAVELPPMDDVVVPSDGPTAPYADVDDMRTTRIQPVEELIDAAIAKAAEADGERAPVDQRQTLRVMVQPLKDRPGLFLVRPLRESEKPAPNTREALLVPMEAGVDLLAPADGEG